MEMMSKIFSLIIALLMTGLPIMAQVMSIEGFGLQKESLLSHVTEKKEKKQAVLLLTTDEKGFTFKADGKTDIQAEEGDGLITLKVPHKTRYLTITHADYGQYTWRAPGKGLRKKKCYHAYLSTYNPDKEYKLQKQWVVFNVTPKDVIIQVDSITKIVRNGKAQFHLTLGSHPYKIVSPFHETLEDTLEVTDEKKLDIPIQLHAIYSFLTIKTPSPECRIYVDDQLIGQYQGVSRHLTPGDHRLSIFVDSLCYYDNFVSIGVAEKKTITITADELKQKTWRKLAKNIPIEENDTTQKPTISVAQESTPIKAPVTIKAADDQTEIWLNRELVGNGNWEGTLDEGYYIIQTQKDGKESSPHYLWVNDEIPKVLNLGTPQIERGFLSVHSNIVGANVFINDNLVGATPCIVDNLPANKPCEVRLEYPLYKSAKQKVLVLGNDMVNVEITMKKKK